MYAVQTAADCLRSVVTTGFGLRRRIPGNLIRDAILSASVRYHDRISRTLGASDAPMSHE